MKKFAIILAVILVVGLVGALAYLYNNRAANLPAADKPFNLLIVGDSVADGVGSVNSDNSLQTYLDEMIRADYSSLNVENKAVPGSKTEEVLNNQLTKLQKDKYTAAVMIVGTNDITHLVSPSKFNANYEAIAKILNQKADIVVLANIPQFSNTPIVPKEIRPVADGRTRSYNNKIDNIANGYGNFRIFNFYAFSQNRLRTEANLIATDGFHPNDAGYKLIAEEIVKKILLP